MGTDVENGWTLPTTEEDLLRGVARRRWRKDEAGEERWKDHLGNVGLRI